MRRKLQLLFLLLLIAGTTETGVRASTDCERWISAYKAELAHAKAMRSVQAAQARLKRAAKRKLANYVKKPAAPRPMRAHFVKPRLTRQQMLDRFNVLCGDLPGGARPGEKLMEGKLTPTQFAANMAPYVPVELASTGGDGILPYVGTPPYTSPGTTVPSEPGGGGFGPPPIFGGGGGPPVISTGTTPPTDTPVTPVVPPPPPVGQVPEPGSLALLLTGALGAVGEVRRRLRK